MARSSPTLFQVFKSIAILPFNVLIVIPSLIYYFTTGDQFSFLASQPNWIIFPIAILALLTGLSLMVQTISLFYKRGKGTLAPWTPTQRLVVEGPYRFVRNPMISGVLCILIAESLFLKSAFIFGWALFFFTINYIYFIAKEEPDLVKRFGADYEEYRKNVPRWIPRSTPWNKI